MPGELGLRLKELRKRARLTQEGLARLAGRGWDHGVGMCQVGAYGMALDGARYEEILKKYYKGIELQKLY